MESLYPAFRERLASFMKELQRHDSRFLIFETVRSPGAQDELYVRGRVPGRSDWGRYATRARAYQSAHQFGMAADVWPHDDGHWEWISAQDPRWAPVASLAKDHELETLSWERPHVQLAGFDWHRMTPGPEGTAEWAVWLQTRNKGIQ